MLKAGWFYVCEACGEKCTSIGAARRHRKESGVGHTLDLTPPPSIDDDAIGDILGFPE